MNKMKLIKINTDHYVVVDDSEIQESDWYYSNLGINKLGKTTRNVENWRFKITHSTRALEPLDGRYIYYRIQPLSLQEVKKLIGEVNMEQIAVDFAGDRKLGAGHGYPSFEANLLERGFLSGYNQALEDNKGKKYTEEDMLRLLYWADSDARNIQGQKFEDFIQSLQPKTDWEVEFVDGKLKIK